MAHCLLSMAGGGGCICKGTWAAGGHYAVVSGYESVKGRPGCTACVRLMDAMHSPRNQTCNSEWYTEQMLMLCCI
jgi:hypothetical protein